MQIGGLTAHYYTSTHKTMFRDRFGNDLKPGDKVIVSRPTYTGSTRVDRGTVSQLTSRLQSFGGTSDRVQVTLEDSTRLSIGRRGMRLSDRTEPTFDRIAKVG